MACVGYSFEEASRNYVHAVLWSTFGLIVSPLWEAFGWFWFRWTFIGILLLGAVLQGYLVCFRLEFADGRLRWYYLGRSGSMALDPGVQVRVRRFLFLCFVRAGRKTIVVWFNRFYPDLPAFVEQLNSR